MPGSPRAHVSISGPVGSCLHLREACCKFPLLTPTLIGTTRVIRAPSRGSPGPSTPNSENPGSCPLPSPACLLIPVNTDGLLSTADPPSRGDGLCRWGLGACRRFPVPAVFQTRLFPRLTRLSTSPAPAVRSFCVFVVELDSLSPVSGCPGFLKFFCVF